MIIRSFTLLATAKVFPNIFQGEELIKASLQNDHILKSIPEKNWDVTYLCLQYDDSD